MYFTIFLSFCAFTFKKTILQLLNIPFLHAHWSSTTCVCLLEASAPAFVIYKFTIMQQNGHFYQRIVILHIFLTEYQHSNNFHGVTSVDIHVTHVIFRHQYTDTVSDPKVTHSCKYFIATKINNCIVFGW